MAATKRRPSAPQAEEKAEIPLGRYLASTEKKTRDGAIKSLASYLALSDREPLSEAEMAKLWKGIFYCFWMSDKPRVQQALAQELADLLLLIKAPSSSTTGLTRPALLFLQGFYDAMVREWPGLDKWRVDKFYLLFRRFTNAAFRLLARHGWEEEGLLAFTNCLTKQGGPLCPNDIKVPDGITYHLADIYLEEMDRAIGASAQSGDTRMEKAPVLDLLQPFINVMATCHSPLVFDRIAKAVIEPFLEDCLTWQEEQDKRRTGGKRKAKTGTAGTKRRKGEALTTAADASSGEDEDEDEDEDEESACEYPVLLQQAGETGKELRRKTFEAIFQAASQSDSVDARRRRLYKMCKEEQDRLEDDE